MTPYVASNEFAVERTRHGAGNLDDLAGLAAFDLDDRALFHALPFIPPDEHVLVGLPDTVWFPEDGFGALGDDNLSFLCFPVERPELFDAVVMDDNDDVVEVQVKTPGARSRWIWGAFKLRARVLQKLKDIWLERDGTEQYIGTIVNRFIARSGRARAVRAGSAYADVGTLHGYREAITLLASNETDTFPRAAVR